MRPPLRLAARAACAAADEGHDRAVHLVRRIEVAPMHRSTPARNEIITDRFRVSYAAVDAVTPCLAAAPAARPPTPGPDRSRAELIGYEREQPRHQRLHAANVRSDRTRTRRPRATRSASPRDRFSRNSITFMLDGGSRASGSRRCPPWRSRCRVSWLDVVNGLLIVVARRAPGAHRGRRRRRGRAGCCGVRDAVTATSTGLCA